MLRLVVAIPCRHLYCLPQQGLSYSLMTLWFKFALSPSIFIKENLASQEQLQVFKWGLRMSNFRRWCTRLQWNPIHFPRPASAVFKYSLQVDYLWKWAAAPYSYSDCHCVSSASLAIQEENHAHPNWANPELKLHKIFKQLLFQIPEKHTRQVQQSCKRFSCSCDEGMRWVITISNQTRVKHISNSHPKLQELFDMPENQIKKMQKALQHKKSLWQGCDMWVIRIPFKQREKNLPNHHLELSSFSTIGLLMQAYQNLHDIHPTSTPQK